MSKIAHYLQEHLTGEVMVSADARRYFSTDASIMTLTPSFIVYPRGENDVRKTARFTWQLAERGRVIPITARGAGSDLGGAALGNGIVLSFPAHMHHILELDDKSGQATVEPGALYGKVQQALHTHDRFLPPYPASLEYSTIGGAAANNTGGEKSFKYGNTRDYVTALRVVLANGEVIQTGRLNKREFNKKLGLATFEGEIYRAVDALLEENKELIDKAGFAVTKDTTGYCLQDIRQKDGSFDLTPLFVGSQGTLGIITEITLQTEPYNPQTTLLVANFDDLDALQIAILELRDLPDIPSAIEMVDGQLLSVVDRLNVNQLKGLVAKPFPRAMLFVEFDDPSERTQKKMAKKARKILERYAGNCLEQTDPAEQESLWKIRYASSSVISHSEGGTRALPFMEDGVVPPERFKEYLEGIYDIFERNHVQPAIWGHAGDGNLHVQPFLDLSQVGDRQKVFKLTEEHADLIIRLGGVTNGENGDGRLRGAYISRLYGPEMYALFQKLKQIFDPYNTLNPGVKVNANLDAAKALLRSSYSLEHLYNHLPRS